MAFQGNNSKATEGGGKLMVDALESPGAAPVRAPYQRLVYFLLFILALAVIGSLASIYLMSRDRTAMARQLDLIDRQHLSAQQIYRNLPIAATGDPEVFKLLRTARDQSDDMLVRIREGIQPDTPALPVELQPEISRLESEWQGLDDGLDLVLQAEASVVDLRESLGALRAHINQIYDDTEELLIALRNTSANPEQIFVAEAQRHFAEQFGAELSLMVDAGIGSRDLDHFKRDVEQLAFFARTVNGLLLGEAAFGIERVRDNTARQHLASLGGVYREASERLRKIMANTLVVVHLRDTVDTLRADTGGIPGATAALRSAYQKLASGRAPAETLGWFFAVLAALALLGLLLCLVAQARAVRRQPAFRGATTRVTSTPAPLTPVTDQRSQDAILRLLDEISVLAEGDLRAQATVTEDMTGAIADAVNYAIEALREMVTNINDTANEVGNASHLSHDRAIELGNASEIQRNGITRVNTALHSMSASVERIAQQASESSQVAESSVEIANAGAVAVRDTIAGMDVIRETIQETAKRIKRLGESSQEIGDIVGLIDDIADQTNVLALNAAIQASMAGESGRGFAVVADEVQRLAERAGQATKQIDALVKAIQSDTHEAVASMESSTAGVVSGAQLSEGAGQALERIETVSQQLAERINSITELAHRHTSQTSEIANTIVEIERISEQTHRGVRANAESVEALAELAEALRKSVEGFRLPDRDVSTQVSLPQQIAARRASRTPVSGDTSTAISSDQGAPTGAD